MTDGRRRTRWIRVEGRDARVMEQGTGPVVILVHGLGLSADLWDDHLDRVARAGYRAIATDLPGFGHSPGPVTGLSVGAAAAWLLKLADALGVDRAAWVGHSIGAQQVVRLAVMAPPRAAALVLAAPTGRAGRRAIRQPAGLLATAFQEPPGLVGSVVRRYLRSPVATVATWIRAMRHDMALDAPRVTCPTLLVVGEHDAVVPDPFVAQLQRLLPDARTHRIEDATHAVALDPVGPFTDAVTAFLARRYSRGASTD